MGGSTGGRADPAVGMTPRRVVVGATGASGCLYLLRTLRALLAGGHRVDLVISKYGMATLKHETDLGDHDGDFSSYLTSKYPEIQGRGELVRHAEGNQGATIASGSVPVDGMIVVPCTMKSLAGIATGQSRNLIERAADVTLKERRPLVLVTRETPHTLVHLRNMVSATEAGAVVLPASPAFYHRPRTFDDLGDFIAARSLALLGVETDVSHEWEGWM